MGVYRRTRGVAWRGVAWRGIEYITAAFVQPFPANDLSTMAYPGWRGAHGMLNILTAMIVGLSPLTRGTL